MTVNILLNSSKNVLTEIKKRITICLRKNLGGKRDDNHRKIERII